MNSSITMKVDDFSITISQILQCCDRVIAGQYRIHEEERDPVVKDGVAITAEEVSVKQTCSAEWRTFCKTKPASVIADWV